MRLSLNTQIFAGALFGIGLGIVLAQFAKESPLVVNSLYGLKLISTLFIDLLKMILVPLVFTSIACGVANLRQHQQLHKVWQVTLGFFGLSMALAIVLGLGTMQIFQPGKGLSLDLFAHSPHNIAAQSMSLGQFFAQFLHGLFVNPFHALADGNVLAIVIFALFMGIALVIGGERYRHLLQLMEEGLAMMLQMVNWVMRLSPLGIAALLAQLLAGQDWTVLSSLALFAAVIVGTTLLHGLVVLPLLLFVVTRISPLRFFRGARPALLTAFATSSSSATLPVTLRCVEHNLHVKPEIGGFVIPLGATINMDGTALYEASAALFIANLAGIDLNLTQQLIVFFTAMLAAIGAPGIPSAGMVTMVMVLQSVGLPAEAIGILLPIDRLLDTFRTMVNVEGDMIGSLVVQSVVGTNTDEPHSV